jgi:hypothetical protein
MPVEPSPEDRERIQAAIDAAGPEFIAKFGNPLDPNDPRHWLPTERAERGLSVNDRVRLLELDMEVMQISMGKVIRYLGELQEKELLEDLKRDPQAALRKLAQMVGEEVPEELIRKLGETEDGPLYAGSVQGQPGDKLVVTPQGTIRVNQIPGYKNDPNWIPSTDWVDMNCLCPTHVAQREENAIDNRFSSLTNPDDDGRGGMYL